MHHNTCTVLRGRALQYREYLILPYIINSTYVCVSVSVTISISGSVKVDVSVSQYQCEMSV